MFLSKIWRSVPKVCLSVCLWWWWIRLSHATLFWALNWDIGYGNLLFSVKGLGSKVSFFGPVNMERYLFQRYQLMPDAALHLEMAYFLRFLKFGHSLSLAASCHSYLWTHCVIWLKSKACMVLFTYCLFVILEYWLCIIVSRLKLLDHHWHCDLFKFST